MSKVEVLSDEFFKERKKLDRKFDNKKVVVVWVGEEHYTPYDILFDFDAKVAELKKRIKESGFNGLNGYEILEIIDEELGNGK